MLRTLEYSCPAPFSQENLAARRRTEPNPRSRRLIRRQRTDARRKSEQIMMPSVRSDRTCVSDRSLNYEWFREPSNVLSIILSAVAACIILSDCAGDVYEVRDGTHAAGVRFGRSRWAFDTVCDCGC